MKKTCLITGGSGFLGNHIVSYLTTDRNKVIRLGRKKEDDIFFDLASGQIGEAPPLADVVIHCAGKVHTVFQGKEGPEFMKINVEGTKFLLNELAKSLELPRSFVFISSVAVYGLEKGTEINEDAPLLASDAYGRSKIDAERIVSKWCEENKVRCTILRLPLIVGNNPPGNLAVMIKGIRKGFYFNIGLGQAKRSMVLAKDVARYILEIAEVGGIYNLTDGYHPDFAELSAAITLQLGKRKRPYALSLGLVKIMAVLGDILGSKSPINTYKLGKITSHLTFDDSRARREFGWNPDKVLQTHFIEN